MAASQPVIRGQMILSQRVIVILVTVSASCLSILTCCASPGLQIRKMTAPIASPTEQRPGHIVYSWKSYHVDTEFSIASGEEEWTLAVTDTLSPINGGSQKQWRSNRGRLPTRLVVQIVATSLARFKKERPNGRLGDILVDSEIDRDLWADVIVELRSTLSKMPGGKKSLNLAPDDLGAEPPTIQSATNHVFINSDTTARFKRLLTSTGLKVTGSGIDAPDFRPVPDGHRWIEIAKLPDLGIVNPGQFWFEVTDAPNIRLSSVRTTKP